MIAASTPVAVGSFQIGLEPPREDDPGVPAAGGLVQFKHRARTAALDQVACLLLFAICQKLI